MTDYGTADERAMALRISIAAKEFNRAIYDATRMGMSIEVKVLTGSHREAAPVVNVGIERRTMILPATTI